MPKDNPMAYIMGKRKSSSESSNKSSRMKALKEAAKKRIASRGSK